MNPDHRKQLWPYYCIIFGVMLGDTSPVLTKLLLNAGLTGPSILTLRYMLTVLALMPVGLYRPTAGARTPPSRRDWIALIMVGVLGSGVGALLFVQAVDLASAGVANALSKTQPLFVAFIAYYALRERISSLRWSLIGVMVAAGLLIGWGEVHAGEAEHTLAHRLLGDVLALGAGLARAAAEVIGKRTLDHFSPRTVSLARFGAGLGVTSLFGLGTGAFRSLATLAPAKLPGIVALLVVLAWVSTALSMVLYVISQASRR